jgi:hypothetical protein
MQQSKNNHTITNSGAPTEAVALQEKAHPKSQTKLYHDVPQQAPLFSRPRLSWSIPRR